MSIAQERYKLGLVAAGKRDINKSNEFDKYFNKPNFKDTVAIDDGTVRDTVELMDEVVNYFIDDTKKIAPTLKGNTVEETCRNIWNWVYNTIQYSEEKGEKLRRPIRSYWERFSGVDCDCMAILVSSLLLNQFPSIPHKFRVTKYGGNWQHVYVVVPHQGKEIIIDCVLDKFNYEKPYTQKFDYTMRKHSLNGIPIAVLSGFGSVDEELDMILSGHDFDTLELGQVPSPEQELNALYNHLVRTRNYIMRNPGSVLFSGGARANLEMLDYAIRHWHTPGRDHALDVLEGAEDAWNDATGLSGFDSDNDYDTIDGIGKVKGKKKFFSKIKDAVKKVSTGVKNTAQKIATGVKNTAQKVATGVKNVAQKAVKAVVRYNPVTVAARGGFLLALKTNLFKIAETLYPALATASELAARRISSSVVEKSKRAYAAIEKLFVNILQGKAENLKKAIHDGRAAKSLIKKAEKEIKKGGNPPAPAGKGAPVPLSGLGEVTVAAVAAGAAPLIAAAKELDKAGIKPADGKTWFQKFTEFFKNTVKKVFKKKDNGTSTEENTDDTSNQRSIDPEAGSSDEEGGSGDSANYDDTEGSEYSEGEENSDGEGSDGEGDRNKREAGSGFGNFLKENIGWVIGGTVALTVAGVGIGMYVKHQKKKKAESAAALKGLSGVTHYKRGEKVKKKKFLPAGSKVKSLNHLKGVAHYKGKQKVHTNSFLPKGTKIKTITLK